MQCCTVVGNWGSLRIFVLLVCSVCLHLITATGPGEMLSQAGHWGREQMEQRGWSRKDQGRASHCQLRQGGCDQPGYSLGLPFSINLQCRCSNGSCNTGHCLPLWAQFP